MSVVSDRRVAFVVNNDPKTFTVIVPEELVGSEQVRALARNFSKTTGKGCSIIYDHGALAFRLTEISRVSDYNKGRFEIVGHAKVATASTPVATAPRIPRPPNAWIIYRSLKSKEIRKTNPGATASYISTAASKMWKNESCAIRRKFNFLALEANRLHKRMYPGYKYNASGRNFAHSVAGPV